MKTNTQIAKTTFPEFYPISRKIRHLRRHIENLKREHWNKRYSITPEENEAMNKRYFEMTEKLGRLLSRAKEIIGS